MIRWSLYDTQSGAFTGHIVRCSPERIAALKGEFGAVQGAYDPQSQRVDVRTGAVVEYQPAQPDADHIWDSASKRWVLTDAVREQRDADAAARATIAAQEALQLRATRELLLDPTNADAIARLHEIDQIIRDARARLMR